MVSQFLAAVPLVEEGIWQMVHGKVSEGDSVWAVCWRSGRGCYARGGAETGTEEHLQHMVLLHREGLGVSMHMQCRSRLSGASVTLS